MQTIGSKKFWTTSYILCTKEIPTATYNSYVVAANEGKAKEILELRGNKELITSRPLKINKTWLITRPSLSYKRRNLVQALHTLSFIGNMAIQAGLIDHNDLLSDRGTIHEITHELEFPEEFGYRKWLHEELKTFDSTMEILGFL